MLLCFPVTITKGAYRDTAVHAGRGRIKGAADYKVIQKGSENTIAFTTYADETITKYLYENLVGATVGTTPASFDIPYDFSQNIALAAAATDWTKTISVALILKSGIARVLKGAKVVGCKKYASVSTDGGREMYDWTISTRCLIDEDVDYSSWTLTAYPTDEEKTIFDLRGDSSVCQVSGIDIAFESYDITINSNISYSGFDADGSPDVIAVGMPNLEVLFNITMLHDSNTKVLFADAGEDSSHVIAIHDNVWASATYGFLASYAKIMDSFNTELVNEAEFITVPFELRGSTSGDVLQVVL